MAEPTVLLAVDQGVAWIRLNRPDRLNAFAGTMREELRDAIDRAATDPEVRVLVITGEGRGFSAGADLEVTSRLATERDDAAFEQLVAAGARVIERLSSVEQPVIAAVNGAAAGAGASLALACDVRLASDRATLGLTFNRIGLHPDWGGSYHLPRLVGHGRAAEIILSARMVGAEEGLRIGLFERVLPAETFADEVRAFALELAAKPPLALRLAKRTLSGDDREALLKVLRREQEAQMLCFRSDDAREGITAFAEKRTPVFHGR